MEIKFALTTTLALALMVSTSCHKDDEHIVADENNSIQTINSKPDDEDPIALNNRELLAALNDNVSDNGSFVIEQAVRAGNWEDGEYNTCSFSYISTTATGQPVWLTGRMAWPKDGDAKNIIVGCHSTITDNASCPSKNLSPIAECGIASAIFASNSLVVFPDYEGFGSTVDRPQAYLCQEATARQVVDGIVAASEELVKRHHGSIHYGYKTVVIGYSQGAAVAMAVQKYLEQGFPGEQPKADALHFAGIVCADGIYDPLSSVKKYVSDDRLFAPVMAPLMVQSLCETHPLLAGQCKTEDFVYADFLNSGILGWINDKNLSTSEIQQKLCDYSINHSLGTGEYAVTAGDPKFAMYGQADLRPNSYLSQTDGYIEMNVVNNDNYYWRTTSGTRYAPPSQMFKKELTDLISGKPAKYDALINFVMAMDANNVLTGWTPTHPMVVFHSMYDEVVPFVNYTNAKKAFSSTSMFHGVIYNARMIHKHNDVGLIFYALYMSKYAYSILNNKAFALEQEITIDGMY
ncbi:MAG: serine hydrolase family protein [Bacteroidales bacterium]|nr:serine hydrolase family protein [Bacteroidales bacterium]